MRPKLKFSDELRRENSRLRGKVKILQEVTGKIQSTYASHKTQSADLQKLRSQLKTQTDLIQNLEVELEAARTQGQEMLQRNDLLVTERDRYQLSIRELKEEIQ